MRNSAQMSQGANIDIADCFPIHNLPPEILGEIFHLCIERSLPRPVITEAPLKLGRICRYWRKLVLSDPSLWCRLSLRRDTAERNVSLDLEILDEWLVRSQRAPLWLSMRYSATPSAYHEIDRVIAKIIPHYYRWQYLELRIPTACLSPIISTLSECPTIVKFLRLAATSPDRTGDGPLNIDLSRQSYLTDLTMYDTRLQLVKNHGAMHTIRTLKLECPTVHDYFKCLDLCPSVEEVRLSFDVLIDFRPSIHPSIHTLPSIRTLALAAYTFGYDGTMDDIGLFIECLQLPGLYELELGPGTFTRHSEQWTYLSELLERSGHPPLKSLKIRIPIPLDEFCACLRKAPGLEVLRAPSILFVNPTLDTLTRRLHPDQPFVCPQLRRVELDYCNPVACEATAELVLRRWCGTEMDADPSDCSISTVVLKIFRDNKVDPFLYYPGIRQCIKDGLLVTSCDRQGHKTVYTYDHSKFSSE
ncbi:hypothetical protein BD410DRAFT_391075 [Rickenella mellea]|uniref:F-box domain-containing protein n=1 Tax=Rickenella mellea TaxID=50990 RepID=A0A4Y7PYJ2_9AGAM|nr:hypothetical protein BD410DRAFT_391075 [Rickenella mellea]